MSSLQAPTPGMSRAGAEQAVTISALIVAGVYAYRVLTEGSGNAPAGGAVKQLAGEGSPPDFGVFITAWGATFLVISMLASAAPGLGGSFALLVASADLLNNVQKVKKDINAKLGVTDSGKPINAAAAGAAHSSTSPPVNGAVSGHDVHRSLGGLQ